MVLETAAEAAFVRDGAIAKQMTFAWIGLKRISATDFAWEPYAGQPTLPLQYSNWALGEPNNFFGVEECVELNTDTGFWNDCGFRKLCRVFSGNCVELMIVLLGTLVKFWQVLCAVGWSL